MKKFYAYGDIKHPVKVEVVAASEEGALEKVRQGEYTIVEVANHPALAEFDVDQGLEFEEAEE